MPLTLWTQRELIGIRRDMKLERPTDWWRRTFFGGTPFYSRQKEIHLGDIDGTRAMAPFALPSHMGKPIFKERGASVTSFTPAYIKLLDAIRPEDSVTVSPIEVLENRQLSMQERFDMRTAEIVRQHLDAVTRTRDWLAARAIIDGKVTIKYHRDQGAAFPEVTIDYGRHADLTVAFSSGADWSDPDADIFEDIQNWVNLGRSKKFGGNFNTMIVGRDVAPIFQRNASVKDKLSTQMRGGEGTSFQRGLIFTNEDANAPTYLGTLGGVGGAIDVWTYSDQQLDNTGAVVEMLNPKDVFMAAPGVDGIEAFGAIYDLSAVGVGGGNVPTDVFQKQYMNDNPSQLNLLTQSAPLPIVRYPNRTFKATVLS